MLELAVAGSEGVLGGAEQTHKIVILTQPPASKFPHDLRANKPSFFPDRKELIVFRSVQGC